MCPLIGVRDRTRRRFAIALALIACLAVGSVSAAVGKPGVKKVKTRVTLNYTQTGTPPYHQSFFSGRVKAKKGCKRNREITITNTGTSAVVASTTSSSDGLYSVWLTTASTTSSSDGSYSVSPTTAAPAGTYQAEAAKKKKKTNNGTKIVCKKRASNTVPVP
jgi:hypothetical protein